MTRKLTTGEVVVTFAQNGITLDDPSVYVNAHTPMMGRCLNGHPVRVRLLNVRDGRTNCLACNRVVIGDSKRATVDAVIAKFASVGITLDDPSSYVNNRTPMAGTCVMGHRTFTRVNSLNRGSGCNLCGFIAAGVKHKINPPTPGGNMAGRSKHYPDDPCDRYLIRHGEHVKIGCGSPRVLGDSVLTAASTNAEAFAWEQATLATLGDPIDHEVALALNGGQRGGWTEWRHDPDGHAETLW